MTKNQRELLNALKRAHEDDSLMEHFRKDRLRIILSVIFFCVYMVAVYLALTHFGKI